jgi:hypothetical protein
MNKKYTTYLWRTSNDAGSYRASSPTVLEDCYSCYYAGMTGEHLEARLVSPYCSNRLYSSDKHESRSSVHVLWSKQYNNETDAHTAENELIHWLWKFEDGKHAKTLNANANLRGDEFVNVSLKKDLKEAKKIITYDYIKVAKAIKQTHKERVEQAIEARAEEIVEGNKEIQEMIAEYIKHHRSEVKRSKKKSNFNIANIREKLNSLKGVIA